MKNLLQILLCVILISGFLWAQSNQDCGLVAYYPFNGNANDESGNGKHGEVLGANLTDDRFGNRFSAYVFDGVNDYILVPHSYFINFDGRVDDYTFAVWFKSGNNTQASRILEKRTHGGRYPLVIQLSTGVTSLLVFDGTNNPRIDFENLFDDEWHFLVCVVNNPNDKIYGYVDGVFVDSTVNTVTSTTAISEPMYIGNEFKGTRPFDGIIDDIRVFSRALTLQEIDSFFHENGLEPTSIEEVSFSIPEKFELNHNYPNPFNPSTKILYSIPKSTFVKMKIYDVTGREVKTLVNQFQTAGSYSIDFNADGLSSGIYSYRLQAGSSTATRKMMVVK